jgi:hypothetical protein
MKLNVKNVVKGNYLSGEVFKDCSEVHGSTRADTLSVVALLQQTVDTTNTVHQQLGQQSPPPQTTMSHSRELKASLS